LRELISKASDVLDKIRYSSITEHEQLETGPHLSIKIILDKINNAVTFFGTGIGMTKGKKINSWKTITEAFMGTVTTGSDSSMTCYIDDMPYSSYVVLDRFMWATKFNDNEQYKMGVRS
jgi:molecular chaperone HtpG